MASATTTPSSSVRTAAGPSRSRSTSPVPVKIPDLDEVRKFAAKLHARGRGWTGEAFGWPAEYNPERPEPPLDSKMTFTPADFCIGESGIWFFSLMWEYGKDAEPIEFLDDRNVVRVLAEPRAPYEIVDSTDERSS